LLPSPSTSEKYYATYSYSRGGNPKIHAWFLLNAYFIPPSNHKIIKESPVYPINSNTIHEMTKQIIVNKATNKIKVDSQKLFNLKEVYLI
jgi:hypothetical protein